jgi:two-component system, sensor histidine kinase and response regulator
MGSDLHGILIEYKNMIKYLRDATAILDRSELVVCSNDLFNSLYGVDSGTVTGKNYFDHILNHKRTIESSLRKAYLDIKNGIKDFSEFACTVNKNIQTQDNLRFIFSPLGDDYILIQIIDSIQDKSSDLNEDGGGISRFKEYFYSFPGAVIVTDNSGDIIDANMKSVELFGYNLNEFRIKTFADIVSPEDKEEFLGYLKKIQNNSEVQGGFVFKNKSSESVFIQINSFSVDRNRNFSFLKKMSSLRTTEKRMILNSTLLENLHDSVVVFDEDGKILEWNKGAVILSGYNRKYAINKNISEFCNANTFSDMKELVKESMEDEHRWQGEHLVKTKNGNQIQVESILLGVDDSIDNKSKFVVVSRDITARKQNEFSLIWSKEQTEKTNLKLQLAIDDADRMAIESEMANSAKSRFIANVSHEFRTPMNGIIGMSKMLLSTELSDDQQESVRIISNSAYSLLNLINEILDYSKVNKEIVELDEAPFDLHKVVQDVIDILSLQANEQGLDLVSIIPPDLPRSLKGDSSRLKQIIMNIAANAIKFTQDGEVMVEISVDKIEGEEILLRCEITDTGIGISHEDQSKIFDSFYQAEFSSTRKYGGTGLGLSITKSIVKRMGGEIGVISQSGDGSKFWFTVKLSLLVDAIACDKSLMGNNILLISSSQAIKKYINTILGGMGASVKTTDNSSQAASFLDDNLINRQKKIDILILDSSMSPYVIKEIIEIINLQKTQFPLLFLQRKGEPIEDMILKYIDDYKVVSKPLNQKKLFNAVYDMLGIDFVEIQPSKTIEETIDKPTTLLRKPISPWQKMRFRILLVEDNIINQKVAVKMLSSMGVFPDVVFNGVEALESIKEINYDLVFMDVQMPEMDGLETTRRIRKEERDMGGRHLPIVAITAHAMKGDREDCLASGMDDYLTKPVSSSDLEMVLGRYMVHNSSGRLSTLKTNFPRSNYNCDLLLKKLGGDVPLFVDIANIFIEEQPRVMEHLSGAIIHKDYSTVVRLAHSLKGAGASIEAEQLKRLAGRVENAARKRRLDNGIQLFTPMKVEFERILDILKDKIEK